MLYLEIKGSQDTIYEQIVLPKRYPSRWSNSWHPFSQPRREKVAHTILRWFKWTTLFQMWGQPHGGWWMKAVMEPLPVIGKSFRRIAMDIAGLLPRTTWGNYFILVSSGTIISASNIAEDKIDIFTWQWTADKILMDQGMNFTSALLGGGLPTYWDQGIEN